MIQNIDEVFDSISVDNFIQVLPQLQKKGRNHICNSPFTDEKTPSFHVFEKSGSVFFKCFSSSKGGTLIDLLQQLKQLNFVEAIKYVAEQNNIQLQHDRDIKQEDIEKVQKLRQCLHSSIAAWHKYLMELPDDHPAWQTIHSRGYDREIVEKYKIGYAPDTWTWMWDQVREAGYYTEAKEIGIVSDGQNGKVYDTHRDRLIFPIYDHNATLISFAGRRINDTKKEPKYINSHNTDLYNKSYTLYGLHLAKKTMRTERNAYLVEGYTDVITMQQAGIENTIATCGTALTTAQCKLIKRFTSRITIMRDGDEAGQNAAMRDFQLLLKEGFEVNIIELADKQDPDDFIKSLQPENSEKLVEV